MYRERLYIQMDHNIHKGQAMFHRCEETDFLFFNLLQNGSSNLYQVFSHTNVAVCILELTADVRHQDICTNHTHKKCSHETHTNGIIQNFNSAKKNYEEHVLRIYSELKTSILFTHILPCVTPRVNTKHSSRKTVP